MRSMLTGGEPEKPLLLYVGRLGAEKNIQMIKSVLEARPDARLAIVGGGPAEADLRKTFEGMPVVFTGLMRGEALSRAYAAADVFVMPSESETLGFVVLEAMASCVPTVSATMALRPCLATRPAALRAMRPIWRIRAHSSSVMRHLHVSGLR